MVDDRKLRVSSFFTISLAGFHLLILPTLAPLENGAAQLSCQVAKASSVVPDPKMATRWRPSSPVSCAAIPNFYSNPGPQPSCQVPNPGPLIGPGMTWSPGIANGQISKEHTAGPWQLSPLLQQPCGSKVHHLWGQNSKHI